MNSLNKRKIYNLIQFIFNNYVSEEHKNLLLLKYDSKYELDDVIDELLIDIYRTYHNDKDKLEFYLEYIANKYLNNKSISSLKLELEKKIESNFACGNYTLKENHQILDETLIFICSELNKRNVDYYVVGSIPIYIKLNLPFSRFHSDIDIAINKKDIHLLNEIFENSNYEYMDNRFCSQKFFDYDEKRARGGHEIIAQNKNNDFSIGFFEFDRLEDGSITKKDYFTEIVDENIISRVCKYSYSKKFSDLYYSKEKLKYKNVEFKYCTVEGIYLIKQKNCLNVGRNKDSYDIKMIEKNYKLDEKKLSKMQELISESANYKIEEI